MDELKELFRNIAALIRDEGEVLLESRGLLGETRLPVPGEGVIGGLMLIGEAPGREETEQGRPFVGTAGKQLDELLTLAGINRGEIYITNVVKYRPYKLSAKGTKSNRPPSHREIELYAPLLKREIEIVRPKLVATLGNTPLHALLGRGATVGSLHGKPTDAGSFTLFPLYHPASVIYDRSKLPALKSDAITLGLLL